MSLFLSLYVHVCAVNHRRLGAQLAETEAPAVGAPHKHVIGNTVLFVHLFDLWQQQAEKLKR